jgi:hypothetical protein
VNYHDTRQDAPGPHLLRPALAVLVAAAVALLVVLVASGSPGTPAEGASGIWTQVSPTAGDEVQSLAVSGNLILGGTYYNGLFRIDGGSTTQPLSAPLAAIAADPAHPSSLIAGAWFEGVFVSSDGGQMWDPDSLGLAAVDVYSLALLDGERFTGTSAGVFYGAPGGWEPRSSGLPTGNVFALMALAPVMYAGTSHGVYTSTDAGLTWQPASSGLGDIPVFSFAAAGSRVVAGTERGVYYSDDRGLTWTTAVGIGATPVRALAASAPMPDTLLAGTADGPFKSVDAGANWVLFDNGLVGEARKVLSLAFAGTSPETVYAGTGAGIWQSSGSDGPPVGGIAEWSPIEPDAAGGSGPPGPNTGVLAGLVAGGVLLLTTAGAWYARRRWLR